MEMMCFGFLAGAIFAILMVMVIRVANNGFNDNDRDSKSSILDDFGECDGVDYCFYKYEKGSAEYKTSILLLAHDLHVMKFVTGLARTEKELLDCAIRYIEDKEGI